MQYITKFKGHEIEHCDKKQNRENCGKCIHYRHSEEEDRYGCYFLWDQCEAINRGHNRVYTCDCCRSRKAKYVWEGDKLCRDCLIQYLHDLVSDDPEYIVTLLNRDGIAIRDIDN